MFSRTGTVYFCRTPMVEAHRRGTMRRTKSRSASHSGSASTLAEPIRFPRRIEMKQFLHCPRLYNSESSACSLHEAIGKRWDIRIRTTIRVAAESQSGNARDRIRQCLYHDCFCSGSESWSSAFSVDGRHGHCSISGSSLCSNPRRPECTRGFSCSPIARAN